MADDSISEMFATPDERAAIAKRRAEQEAEEREWRLLLTEQMSTPMGRRFVSTLLESHDFCGLNMQSFSGHADGGLATAFNEGKRSVGVALLEELQRLVPMGWLRMMEERMDRFNQERLSQPEEKK